ncbi:hypothetical protein [Streptomyces sp. NPDC057682]|uniref:hypothetical protein n=1 Tax=Streptomyces sp. NPDC057682 TaxID=3346210 RepID=UPI00369EDF6A
MTSEGRDGREGAGADADAVPSSGGCGTCDAFTAAEEAAQRAGDGSRETDFRVLRRRHTATAHGAEPA